jgi:subtilisin family serine protease
VIGLIDGPVAKDHPDLTAAVVREVPGKTRGLCTRHDSVACRHGTFVAGILCARKGSGAPAICPDCTLVVRPIFSEAEAENGQTPITTPSELARAIIETVDEGARIINLSAGMIHPTASGERQIEEAIGYAARRETVIVAAAGNQGIIGSSAITRHAWVIPVVACDQSGRPVADSNLGNSIGRRGFMAPGKSIQSIGVRNGLITLDGTSVATPFLTGTIALLLSKFPGISGSQVKTALLQAHARGRRSVIPPLLNAFAVYQFIKTTWRRK